MPRADLLALTVDDLVTLANRGLVRRAQSELDAGTLTYEIAEDAAGSLTVRWSDAVECRLPADKALADASCTCPAVTLCRHLLRSVLAYQRSEGAGERASGRAGEEGGERASRVPSGRKGERATAEQGEAPEGLNARTPERLNAESDDRPLALPPRGHPARPLVPWDPGTITDEEMGRHFRKAVLERARRRFEEGHVIELVRGGKPGATIHTLSCSLRFLVPSDVRYAHCDCAEPAPCTHVPLAVWAFRQLAADREAGLIVTRAERLPAPVALLDDLEAALRELTAGGVAGAAPALVDRFRRLETRCRGEGPIWPAEIVAELVQQLECYAEHDGRFAPARVAELVGELIIRGDAIRTNTGAVPPLFVRGSASDQETAVGSARLVGLGCAARVFRGSVELMAYLQDLDSGTVVGVGRGFADPPPGEPARPFRQLAAGPALRGVPFAALGSGQLLVRGGKRSASGRFSPGRAPASANPQRFQWESLRPPLRVEEFAELAARLAVLPPATLRPRRVGVDLHVCAVTGVDAVTFSAVHQATCAVLRDATGSRALLLHPYHARGAAGSEALLQELTTRPEALRFVAGHVRAGSAGLVLTPVSLIFEEDGARRMLQPWIAGGAGTGDDRQPMTEHRPAPVEESWDVMSNPLADYVAGAAEALGELLLLGVQRADETTLRAWEALSRRGAGLGLHRVAGSLARFTDALAARQHTLRWDPAPAAVAVLEIAVLVRAAAEQLGAGSAAGAVP